MEQDIHDIVRLYARREATPEQRDLVREYIYDNTDRFIELLQAMRYEAMGELGLNVSDDFLPELIDRCAPGAYFLNRTDASSDMPEPISACMPMDDEDDIFTHLCHTLLD